MTEKGGVEAVIEGLGSFLSGIGKINSAISAVNTQVKITGSSIEVMGYKFDAATSRWRDLTNAARGFVAGAEVAQAFANQVGAIVDSSASATSAVGSLTGGMSSLLKAATSLDGELQEKPKDIEAVATSASTLTNFFGQLGGAMSFILPIINQVGGAFVDFTVNVLDRFTGTIRNAISGVTGFLSRVAQIGLGVAFGKVIQQVTGFFRDLTSQIYETVASFQLLEIRFRTIAARDLAREFGGSLTDFLDQASESAQNLLGWTRELAITTPFNTTTIATALAMANAYGLTTGQSQVLLKSTLDLAAGMGLTEEHIKRIIYNLGQIVEQGKLTGREIRDLAVSFFPINDILAEMAEEAGISTAEFKQMALDGLVPVNAVLQKFVDIADRDFAGAAENMSRTIAGVIDNFKDFINTTVGMYILGPVSRSISGGLNDVFDTLRSPEVVTSARVIGEVLNKTFTGFLSTINRVLIPSIDNFFQKLGIGRVTAESFATGIAFIVIALNDAAHGIATFLDNLGETFQNTLGSLEDNGRSWGLNLVISFAKGMAEGIKFIVNVISQIISLINSWFSPGSPPKIAPNIDEWGTSMVDEFAKGMRGDSHGGTGAVKDAIKNIGDGVKKGFDKIVQDVGDGAGDVASAVRDFAAEALSAVQPLIARYGASVTAGLVEGFNSFDFNIFNDVANETEKFIRSLEGLSIPEEGIVPRILGTREAIITAVRSVKEGTSSVADAFNNVITALGEAPKGFLNYAEGLIKLTSAQKNLDIAENITADNLANNDELVRRLTGDVRNLGRDYANSLRQLASANDEAAAAQDSLNRIQEHYKQVLKELNDQLTQVTDVYDENLRLREIDKAIATGLLTSAERERLEMEKRQIEIKRQIRATEDQRDAEQAVAEDRLDAAKEAQDLAKEQADEQRRLLLETAQAQVDAAREQVESAKALIELQTQQNDLIREQMQLLESLARQSAGSGSDQEGGAFNWDVPPIEVPELPDIKSIVDKIMGDAQKAFEDWKKQISDTILETLGVDSWDQIGAWFKEKITDPGEKALKSFKQVWDETIVPIAEFYWTLIQPALEELKKDWDLFVEALTGSKDGEEQLAKILDGLGALGSIFILGTLYVLSSILGTITDGLNAWKDATDNVKKTWEDFSGPLDEMIESLKETDNWIGKIAIGIGIVFHTVVGIIATALATIANIIIFQARLILITLYNIFIKPFYDYFKNLYDDLVGNSIVPEMMDKIYDIIFGTISDIRDKVSEWKDDVIEFFGDLKTNLTETAENTWASIQETIQTVTDFVRDHIVQPFIDGIHRLFLDDQESMQTEGENWFSKAKDGTQSVIDTFFGDGGLLPTFFTNVKTTISGQYQGLYDAASSAFKGVRAGIESVVNSIGGWISEKVQGWIDLINRAKSLLNGGSGGSGGTQDSSSGTTSPVSNGITGRGKISATAAVSTNNSRTTIVNVDANYAQTQSPVDIYYDISAALASAI